MLTEMPQMMPVKVEIPVNHESIRQLPESIRQRLDETPKSAEEIAADSARNTERSSRLREQHIAAVKERAARETQRGEEAAARKRRQESTELQQRMAKMEETKQKTELKKREMLEKREEAKAKREKLAESVLENRQNAHVAMIKKGLANATRACAAVTSREKQVADVVMRTGAQVKHALAVAAAQKEKKESGETERNSEALDSPHPALIESERLASPHPAHAQLQNQIQTALQQHNPEQLQKCWEPSVGGFNMPGVRSLPQPKPSLDDCHQRPHYSPHSTHHMRTLPPAHHYALV